MNKNADPHTISKSRQGERAGTSSSQNGQIASKLRNSYNNGQVVMKPSSPQNYQRNLVVIPHQAAVQQNHGPVSAYIAVSPKSQHTNSQYKY